MNALGFKKMRKKDGHLFRRLFALVFAMVYFLVGRRGRGGGDGDDGGSIAGAWGEVS